ncbi:uncharacterized protein LOC129292747 [Prosopis cineraria]|uniref:uncharacterized protein LOC129292747 n=1 Tax=Prosopis cineraria TaxID=364024 RepID=UPI00240F4987|nr:uncharacterized protein LOC129292747 [Prosopis cineraria]
MMRLRTMEEEGFAMLKMVIVILMVMLGADAADRNDVYSPCSDAKVQKGDGFSFGVAFSNKESFFLNQGPQLSPCDSRLNLSGKAAQLAVFRPHVDQISFLTINGSSFDPAKSGGFMVAFAGHQYAAISAPVMFSDNSHTITSFTLILEFKEGTLQNLIWKSFGCEGCSGESVCLNNQDCAVTASKCQNNGVGGCNIGIQLAFTGTDKNLNVLNSWYQVRKLRLYSLPSLFSDLPDSIISP